MRMSLPELSQHEKTAQRLLQFPRNISALVPLTMPTFLTPSTASPSELCGLLDSEREWMGAFAFGGKLRSKPLTEGQRKLKLWAFEKIHEVYS